MRNECARAPCLRRLISATISIFTFLKYAIRKISYSTRSQIHLHARQNICGVLLLVSSSLSSSSSWPPSFTLQCLQFATKFVSGNNYDKNENLDTTITIIHTPKTKGAPSISLVLCSKSAIGDKRN